MAAAKAKAKKAAPKKASKEAPAKKRTRKAKPKRGAPKFRVENHGFAPGTKVRFLPTFKVTVERQLNREPIPTPDKTATVKANGNLEVAGLSQGMWCAAGLDNSGESWRYVQFPVNLG
jgi:plastocyanin